MEATLKPDRFWRLVLTAEIRKALGLKPGDRLRAHVTAGRLELEPEPINAADHLKRKGGRLVYTGPVPGGYDAAKAVREERDARA